MPGKIGKVCLGLEGFMIEIAFFTKKSQFVVNFDYVRDISKMIAQSVNEPKTKNIFVFLRLLSLRKFQKLDYQPAGSFDFCELIERILKIKQ